jgi:hypothetical protein
MRGRALLIGLVVAVPLVASAQPRDTDPQQADVASSARDTARVDLGLELMSRALSFESRAYPQAPPSLRSSSPGARIAGEVYPFARDPRPLVAGLGLAGEYEKSLGLHLAESTAPDLAIPVDQHRWSIGARFRYAFGDASMPTATLALDYADRVYAVDRSFAMVDVPDVAYAGFEPGVDVRAPITRTIALLAGARLLLLQSAGDIASDSQYGGAHVSGGRAMTGVDFVLGRHFAMRVEGDIAIVGMSFYGTGMQATNRDGDPSTLDVGGASDHYWGGSVTMAAYY